jgi:uncharacterized secreted protein with C-terminal beta-propeller domain
MVATVPSKQLVCNPNVTFQRLGDELVVVNLESDTIYTLNETAAIVWEMLQNGSDVDDIRARLSTDYNVAHETVYQELMQALTKLRDFGLVSATPVDL